MKPSQESKKIIESILTRNVVDIIERDSLVSKLNSGKKLRIKLGCDPTKPDLHLGHAVILWELKKFQDLGHTIVFIIGDFTTRIGDPSGRKAVKKPLSVAEIGKNAKTYFAQVGKILDVKKTKIHYNSQWLAKLDFAHLLKLAGLVTVSRILERDDFKKRLQSGAEVWMHELLYPISQAYDSVMVKADIEVGGTDQLFNFMMARHIQERMGQPPEDIITFKILVGTDGKEKMSKSIGNVISLTDRPADMFGKVMSLGDELILDYFRMTTNRSLDDIRRLEERLEKGENPRNVKLELAKDIVSLYHGKEAAEKARADFIRVFSQRELPTEMARQDLSPGSYEAIALLLALGFAKSRSEASRLVSQGAVEIIPRQGLARRLNDPRELISISDGSVIRVGKTRFARIRAV